MRTAALRPPVPPIQTPTIHVFGLPFFDGNLDAFTAQVETNLRKHHALLPIIIFTPNPEQIVISQENLNFFMTLQKANYLIPDGGGIVLASKLLHTFGRTTHSLTQRLTGVEVVHRFLHHFSQEKMLLIGGKGYEHLAHATLRGEEQGIPWFELEKRQIYWLSGYKDAQHPTPEEEQKIKEAFTRIKPDFVFVAFGAPTQEKWVSQHLHLLQNTKVKLVMVVGGSFDFLTQKVKRAPQIWQDLGGEWLYRLFQEPWRWKRQLRLIKFGWLTLRLLQHQH
jgi:N-acetylglucosaminyldiphosphoundecaprenol N-acetyl-beta-D-mannosaminyltransferase